MRRLTPHDLALHLGGGPRPGDGDPLGGDLRLGGAFGAAAQGGLGGVPPVLDVDGPREVGGEDAADAQRELPDGADHVGVQERLQGGEPLVAVGDAPALRDAAALVLVAAAVVGEGVPELAVRHGEMGADGEPVGDRPVQWAAGEQGVDRAVGQAVGGGGVGVCAPAGQVGGGGGEVGLGGRARVHGEEGGVVGGPDLGEPAQAPGLEDRLGGGRGQHRRRCGRRACGPGWGGRRPRRGARRTGRGAARGRAASGRAHRSTRPSHRRSWPRTALSR